MKENNTKCNCQTHPGMLGDLCSTLSGTGASHLLAAHVNLQLLLLPRVYLGSESSYAPFPWLPSSSVNAISLEQAAWLSCWYLSVRQRFTWQMSPVSVSASRTHLDTMVGWEWPDRACAVAVLEAVKWDSVMCRASVSASALAGLV